MMTRTLVLAAAAILALCAGALADGSKLAPGDIIGVTVDGEKEFSKAYQINNDGRITMPMLDPVSVAGLNTSDAAAAITAALGAVLVNPQVSVVFVERAKMQVFVVGQVKRPGLVEVGVGDRVIQALAQAGYDDTADLSHVTVRRADQVIEVDVGKYLAAQDLQVNVELRSGDTIVVPAADMIGKVMVLGQVSKVGSVPLKRGMTFREAMGLIGGVTVEADTEKITVKREGLSEPLRVEYKRAMDGDPSADIALQPGDTIYVPQIETAFFTVMGGVNRPGQYPLKGKLTLSEAIGVAGGPAPEIGDLRKVQLMRASADPAAADTVNVDVTKVMERAVPDPLVQRGDVIYVAQHRKRTNIFQAIQSILPFAWLF